jgi:hypothetical protein
VTRNSPGQGYPTSTAAGHWISCLVSESDSRIDLERDRERDPTSDTHKDNDLGYDLGRDTDRHMGREPDRDTDRNIVRKLARMLATNKAPMLAGFKETMFQVLKQAEMLAQMLADIGPSRRPPVRSPTGKSCMPHGPATTGSAAEHGRELPNDRQERIWRKALDLRRLASDCVLRVRSLELPAQAGAASSLDPASIRS